MASYGFQLTRLSPTTYQIDISHFRQRQVNLFLIIDDLLTLIDSGHFHPSSTIPLHQALAQLGLSVRDISQIIYTHSHLDHVGGGLSLRHLPDIHHLAHPGVIPHLANYYDYSTRQIIRFKKFIHRAGAQSFREHVEYMVKFFVDYNLPAVSGNITHVTPLRDRDQIAIGRNRYLSILHTPGHTPWDISLYNPEDDFLFVGDFMSAQGNTMLAEVMHSNLDDYVKSLHYVLDLNPGKTLPAHGKIVDHPEVLFKKALKLTSLREENILKCLDRKGKTICDISLSLSENSTADSLVFLRYLGLTATLLNSLIKAGKVKEKECGGISIYHLSR